MGYDLYGLSPHNPKEIKKPESPDWKTATKDEQDSFFRALNKYEDEVPGHYFRNNVWWWRPLWHFVTVTCDNILTEKDMEQGSFNDGHKISKTKAVKIAKNTFFKSS